MTVEGARVAWCGPPEPWASALGLDLVPVSPDAVETSRAAAVVLRPEALAALAGWLGRPRARPPVLVVGCETLDDEAAALGAGADAALASGARPDDARRAFAHAAARHRAAQRDAEPGPDDAADETARRLRDSEARYRSVVRALPDVVSRIQDDGQVLDFYVPPAFETEFPAEAMVGQILTDVIPEDLARRFLDGVRRMRLSGETASYDYQVSVGERVKHREVRLSPLGDDQMISMIRDVTLLREHEAALEASRADLRALAAGLQGVREEERTRLSREVHDVLGQLLTAIRLSVGWFARHFPDDAEVQQRVERSREIIDETIGHVRQIATDLRPGLLDDLGLASAVEWQAGRFEEHAGLTCLVTVVGDAEPPADVATAAFRVYQEALTNVARHAEAETVRVRLELAPDAVRLDVADDGRGMAPPPPGGRRSLGVLGMRERARALGGDLAIESAPDQGTRVRVTLPVPPPDRP